MRTVVCVALVTLAGCIGPAETFALDASSRGDPAELADRGATLLVAGDDVADLGALVALPSGLFDGATEVRARVPGAGADSWIALVAYRATNAGLEWTLATVSRDAEAGVGLSLDPAEWVLLVAARSDAPVAVALTLDPPPVRGVPAVEWSGAADLAYLRRDAAGSYAHHVRAEGPRLSAFPASAGLESFGSSHAVEGRSVAFALVGVAPLAGVARASATWLRDDATSESTGAAVPPATIRTLVATGTIERRSELRVDVSSLAVGEDLEILHVVAPYRSERAVVARHLS